MNHIVSIVNKTKLDRELDPEYWLQEYGDSLYRYALMQLKNQAAAEDVVQDALLSAYRAREQFQGKSSIKTWLTTILRNKIIDHVRKGKRDPISGSDMLEEDKTISSSFSSTGIWSKWLNSWTSSPEKLVEQQAFITQLTACLTALPSNLRQVFILRIVDNLETEEICEQLNISQNNVWVILYRSRMRLRECLEKNWFNQS